MTRDDDLRVRPGRSRSTRNQRARPFIAQALAAAEKAGGMARRYSASRRTGAFGRGRAASLTATRGLTDRSRISVETVALFIRFWLMATPSLPEQTQAAARAKGAERYEGFVQALGRRLAKGPGLIREVSLDIGEPGASKAREGEELAKARE